MTHEQVHDLAWEWMKKATEELRDIAKEADKAAKVGKLADAVEMKRIKKQALDGVLAVSKIFGKVVQAGYSYDRTAQDTAEETNFGPQKDEKKGEWNLHLMKARSRWRYTMANPHGGSFGMGNYPSMQAALAAGMRVDWKKQGSGKKKVWVIVSDWNGEDYVTKKTYWLDIPEELLSKDAPKPSQAELMDMLTR